MTRTVSDLPPYFHVGIICRNPDGTGSVYITDGRGHGAVARLDVWQLQKLSEVEGVELEEGWAHKTTEEGPQHG